MDKDTSKKLDQLELARQAMLLEDQQSVLQLQREVARQYQSSTLGVPLEAKPDVIQIGDTVTNNYTQTETTTSQGLAAAPSMLKKLLPLILTGAGLLAGGVGGAGLVAMLTKTAAQSVDWPAKEFDIFWNFDGKDFKVDKIQPVQPK